MGWETPHLTFMGGKHKVLTLFLYILQLHASERRHLLYSPPFSLPLSATLPLSTKLQKLLPTYHRLDVPTPLQSPNLKLFESWDCMQTSQAIAEQPDATPIFSEGSHTPALHLVTGASAIFALASNKLALAASIKGYGCTPAEILGHIHEINTFTPPQNEKAHAPTPMYHNSCDNEGGCQPHTRNSLA